MPTISLFTLDMSAIGARGLTALIALAVIAFLVAVGTYWYWVPMVLRGMADRDFLITAVAEGTAKAFMRYGELERIAMCWKGYRLNTDWEVVPANDPGPHVKDHWFDSILPGGLRWKGLPFATDIYRYHFQWNSMRQGVLGAGISVPGGIEAVVRQDKLEDLLVSRDLILDYVLLKEDIYGITFQDIEDKEMIPLSAIALMTIRVVNIYKTLFSSEQWLEQVTNFLRSHIKDYIGAHEFSALANTKGSRAEADEILGYNSPQNGQTIGDYILAQWGVRISHLNLVNFKTSGRRGAAYEEAAATRYLKHQEAEGIIELGKAEAKRALEVATALKDTDNGLEVRTIEALEKMGEKGNTFVLGGGSIVRELLNTVAGGKKS